MAESVKALLERNGIDVNGTGDWPGRLDRFLKFIDPTSPRRPSFMHLKAYSRAPVMSKQDAGAYFQYFVALVLLEQGISPLAMNVKFIDCVPDPMDIVFAWEDPEHGIQRAVIECKNSLRERWKTVALSVSCLVRHPTTIFPHPNSAYYIICGEPKDSSVAKVMSCKRDYFDRYKIPFIDNAVTIATPLGDRLIASLAGRRYVDPLVPGAIVGKLITL